LAERVTARRRKKVWVNNLIPPTKTLRRGVVKLPVMDEEIVGFEPEEG